MSFVRHIEKLKSSNRSIYSMNVKKKKKKKKKTKNYGLQTKPQLTCKQFFFKIQSNIRLVCHVHQSNKISTNNRFTSSNLFSSDNFFFQQQQKKKPLLEDSM
jgi:hypothetical protein